MSTFFFFHFGHKFRRVYEAITLLRGWGADPGQIENEEWGGVKFAAHVCTISCTAAAAAAPPPLLPLLHTHTRGPNEKSLARAVTLAGHYSSNISPRRTPDFTRSTHTPKKPTLAPLVRHFYTMYGCVTHHTCVYEIIKTICKVVFLN